MKIRVTIWKYHSWYLYQISLQIMLLTSPKNTITYHYFSLLVTPKFCRIIVFSFSWELNGPQEKLKIMLIQNFWVTNKEHYGMLWYFLEWSITYTNFRMKSIFNRRVYINYNLGNFNKASKQATTISKLIKPTHITRFSILLCR